MSIINGYTRFDFYLIKLEALLLQASKEKNPGLWVYTNNVRTPLFMLEGLAKLYAGIHNKKRFEKIKAHFKLLEDTLGSIDYYDCFAKEFTEDPKIPNYITAYLQAQSREKVQRLNDILLEYKWIGDGANRISKIRKRLQEADWKEPKDELKSIFDFYTVSISEIKQFMVEAGDEFTEIEAQIHAIRRKMRWLSIYPQALQGVIQLHEGTVTNETVTKYLTPEIVNSPFNTLPDKGENVCLLLLEKNYFLALSWMIAELGRLKDSGLKILCIVEALEQIEGISRNEALEKAHTILGLSKDALPGILRNASSVCKTYFSEKNIDKLIYGINTAKI